MARYEGKHSSTPARVPKHAPKSDRPAPKPPKPQAAKAGPSHVRTPAPAPERARPTPAPLRAEKTGPSHVKAPASAPRPGKERAAAPAPRPEKVRPVQAAARTEAAKRKRRRKKLWRACLALYALVLLIGSGYGLWRFWRYVGDEQAQKDRTEAAQNAKAAHEKALFQAPQLAFEDWENALTTDYWTDLWYEQSPNDLDTRDAVYDYMRERFAPDAVQAYKAPEFTQESPVYVLQNGGGEALARVTLTGRELDWAVSDVELLFQGEHSAAVTVPSTCKVLCNGQELGEEYRQEAETLMGYHALDGVLENPVAWVRYAVDGLLLKPEMTAQVPEGFDLLPIGDEQYLLADKSDTAAYAERAVEFVKKDVYYFMCGGQNPGATWAARWRICAGGLRPMPSCKIPMRASGGPPTTTIST